MSRRGQIDQRQSKLWAVTSGDVRLDIDPLDLLRALAGVTSISAGPDGKRAAKRMVDILIGGIRTGT
jgi:hypothetical protein